MTPDIILLDLNYTLSANRDKIRLLSKSLEDERYRQWLVELIRDLHVILITARGRQYQDRTLANIGHQTGWLPAESFFNYGTTPPEFKEQILVKHVLPRFPAAQCLAIESNPLTRIKFHSHGIRTVTIRPEDKPWKELPEGTLTEETHE